MSLASVGPTLGLDVSSHPAYVRDPAQDKQGVPSSRISGFLEGGGDRGVKREIYSRVVGESSSVGRSSETASSESSSIGVAGDSEDEDENEDEDGEVQSKVSGGLGSLGSLEDSLPIKRGLSNHFTGKSKSFANLMEVSEMKEIEKAEKPLNKRRRTLLACKWSRRSSSFYTWSNPNSMSLLPLNEHQEEADSSEEQEEHKSFNSPSSLFSKDLQH